MVGDDTAPASAHDCCYECGALAAAICHGTDMVRVSGSAHGTMGMASVVRAACADHIAATQRALCAQGFVVHTRMTDGRVAPPIAQAGLELLSAIVAAADEGALDGVVFSFDPQGRGGRGDPSCHPGCECVLCEARAFLKQHGLWKEPT